MAITISGDGITSANIADSAITSAKINDGTITTDDINTSAVTNLKSGRKNLIINGAMQVWQRGTSFTAGGKEYNADRWWVNQLSTVGTMSRQSASLDGFQYCLRVQRDSGNTSTSATYLTQDLESVDSMKTRGQKVTLSFWARKGADYSAASDQLTVNLVSGTGTDQTLNSGYTGGTGVISQTPTLTTSWQKFSYTTTAVIASTVNQLGVQIIRGNVGTAGANDYYEITGVQLELGDTATDFEHRSYGEELDLCQRYYQTYPDTFNQHIAVGSSSWSVNQLFLPTTMRVNPTVSYSLTHTNASNGYVASFNNGRMCRFGWVSTTSGGQSGINVTSLAFDSEL